MIFFDKQGVRLFLIFFLITCLFVFYPNGNRYDAYIFIIYLIGGGVSLFGMFSRFDDLMFSTNKTFYVFHYFFFCLAPIAQFKKNITFFDAEKLSTEIYFELGFCLVLLQVVYLMSYEFLKNRIKYKCFVKKFDFVNSSYSYYSYVIVSVFVSLIFLYLISADFSVTLFKPVSGWQKTHTKHGLIGYTLFLIVRAIPVIVFLLYKLNTKVVFIYRDILLLFFVFLVSFPTSMPRATMASYYLPIVIIYFLSLSKKHTYVLSFLVLFFIMFPVFNFFRSFKLSDVSLGIQLFETAHMDAFHNFAQLYFQKIITNGKQLLGSIFFFIQETYWVDKPVGSGQMLAELNAYNYTNISMPLWGEGYVNFGLSGILFFCLLIAFVNSFLDVFYKLNNNNYGIIYFLFFIGYEFYLLRGDLYSSFKKLFSFILALAMVKLSLELIKFFSKKISSRLSDL